MKINFGEIILTLEQLHVRLAPKLRLQFRERVYKPEKESPHLGGC